MKKEWNILPKKKGECYLKNEWLKFVLHVGLVDERPDPETSCPNNLEKDIVKSMKLCSRKYLLLAPCSLVGVMYIDDDLIRIWAENYKVLKNIFFKIGTSGQGRQSPAQWQDRWCCTLAMSSERSGGRLSTAKQKFEKELDNKNRTSKTRVWIMGSVLQTWTTGLAM